jgi:dATP pyrophosphohydrolase
MPRLDLSYVEAYVFRRRQGRLQFLTLRRRPGGTLPGVWQPVTGKLWRGETAARGALREVREETGVSPRRLWRLESVSTHYDPRREAIRIVTRFAAELDSRAEIQLSREHTAYRFMTAEEAARSFLWDSQRAGLAEARRLVARGGERARALEIVVADRSR